MMMEQELNVKKIAVLPAEASGVPAVLDEAGVAFQRIACVDWEKDFPYAPEVAFRIAHTGNHILLEYQVVEDSVAAMAGHDNGRVWEDSCCEFFVQPTADGPYYNVECNCTGTVLLGCGPRREGREHAPASVLKSIKRWSSLGAMPFTERLEKTRWNLALIIPVEAFFHHAIISLEGMPMRANFYKCGDKLTKPHFLSWQKITVDHPDFHRPEFFGSLLFA